MSRTDEHFVAREIEAKGKICIARTARVGSRSSVDVKIYGGDQGREDGSASNPRISLN